MLTRRPLIRVRPSINDNIKRCGFFRRGLFDFFIVFERKLHNESFFVGFLKENINWKGW